MRRRAGLGRPLGRPRPRRVPGIRDAVAARLRQPGLEGCGRRRAPPGRELATPPIALVELQGYVYDAKLRMADLFEPRRPRARRQAPARRGRGPVGPVQRAVLVGRRGRVLPGAGRVQAADRDRRLQPGHLLSEGIVARKTPGGWRGASSPTTCGPAGGSGRCPRTTPRTTRSRITTGSVWPHDNAIIAGGLRRYGFAAEAAQVAKGMFDAAEHLGFRLPEALTGQARDATRGISGPLSGRRLTSGMGVGGSIVAVDHRSGPGAGDGAD